ncbi:cell wall hydrolase [Patescibacteria group bacterium]|nr:cell wall hydrolase [Patescibacteria group bacterium]
MSKLAALCLLSVVYGEARGEPEEGKQAVASVVLNRSRDSGKTICEVTKEKGQFRPSRPPKNFSFALRLNSPIEGATYFRNYPGKWGRLRFLGKIGGHYFYGK